MNDDCWARWLAAGRDGGNAALGALVTARVAAYVERLLDAAGLPPSGAGTTLVDVGCGQGAVALRAIERTAGTLEAIFVDHSAALLEVARAGALGKGIAERCRFVQASAEDLAPIATGSAGILTSRACLAYVADKRQAFAEFARVLAPGGRLSIAEPIFRDDALSTIALRALATERADRPGADLARLLLRWKSAQFPDTVAAMDRDPLTSFTERDLLALARNSGFGSVRVELVLETYAMPPMRWEQFIQLSPHPLAPSLGELLATRYTPADAWGLERALRAGVEEGGAEVTDRVAYLSAVRAPVSAAADA